MSYQVSARKWRPQAFKEVVGQLHVARTLKNAIANNRIAHAYLFSGMRGVGKTTMARILAKALNCKQTQEAEPCNECDICREISNGACPDVIEIDGASNTSVDNVRELRERVLYAPSRGKYKVYIVDEVHMLSKSAFNAFLKTLEEPPPHTVFIFATTESQKIPDTIQSRCQCFTFKGLTTSEIVKQLKSIAEKENVEFKGHGLELIARKAEGGMRDALVSFDQAVSYSGNEIDEEKVRYILGVVGFEVIQSITQNIIDGDISGIISIISEVNTSGTDLKVFCRDLMEHLRNLTIYKMVKNPEEFIDTVIEEEFNSITKQAETVDSNALQSMFQILLKTEYELKQSNIPILVLEMGLIKMTTVRSMKAIGDILKKISEISIEGFVPGTVSLEKASLPGKDNGQRLNTGKSVEQPKRIETPTNAEQTNKTENIEKPGHSKEIDFDLWIKIKECAGEKKPRLCGILEHVTVLDLNDKELVLGFNDAGLTDFYKKGINSDMEIFKKAILEVSGKELDIVISDSNSISDSENKKKTVNRDNENWKKKIVQNVLDYFPGMVVEQI